MNSGYAFDLDNAHCRSDAFHSYRYLLLSPLLIPLTSRNTESPNLEAKHPYLLALCTTMYANVRFAAAVFRRNQRRRFSSLCVPTRYCSARIT